MVARHIPRWSRRYWQVGLLLLGLLLGTGVFRVLRLAWLERHVEAARQAQLDRMAARIEADLLARQQRLLTEARRLAQHATVRSALQTLRREDNLACPETLVALLARRTLPERRGIEIYDVVPRRVAWAGVTMPVGTIPNTEAFLRQVQVELVDDPPWRLALSLWHPVIDAEGHALGAVRVLELLRRQMPVENLYLDTYNQLRLWERELGVTVQLLLPGQTAPADGQAAYPLQGLSGRLGTLLLGMPAPSQVLRDAARRIDHILALWATALLVWALIGLAGWMWTARERPQRLLKRAALVGLAWWGARYLLLILDVPNRWQRGRTPLAPLFDPAHLASAFGGGLMRSIGDLLLTALFALGFALGVRRVVAECLRSTSAPAPGHMLRAVGVRLVAALLMLGPVVLLGLLVRHSVLDSTLDYLTRTGLFPPRLVLLVWAGLLVLLLALLVLLEALGRGTGWLGGPGSETWHARLGLSAGPALAVVGVAYVLAPLERVMPLPVALVLVGAGLAVSCWKVRWPRAGRWLTLRALLPVPFVLGLLLYPMLHTALDAQRRMQVERALDQFGQGQDPRLVFAIEQALQELAADSLLGVLLTTNPDSVRLDSLADAVLRGSLLGSLTGTYEVNLTFFDRERRPIGRYEGSPIASGSEALAQDAAEFAALWQAFRRTDGRLPFIMQLGGRREPGRLQYAGFGMVRRDDGRVAGWVMVRAEPISPLYGAETPFPRVLVPAGFAGALEEGLSLAEFRDGVLVRSQGPAFARYRLDPAVAGRLRQQPVLWRYETENAHTYLTCYRRVDDAARTVHAARLPALSLFDHLYYLLRLTLTGLLLMLAVYAGGLIYRWRKGWLPLPEARFQDRVLNALVGVGFVAVVVVGVVGVRVLEAESQRAVQAWLRQYLDRVERTLTQTARPGELPYQVLDRVPLDSIARRAGLDLQLYRGGQLIATTRPRLVRERLIEPLMPVAAYEALYCRAQRSAFVPERLGTFAYWTGYRALLDEAGRPRYVVAVPALPEQERLEEERARTVAYLFGALLVLMFLVLLTAWLVARALVRPLARLREGLQAVARGELDRPLPVESRDELGALARTFNWMLRQLAESREQLARQERELAWREMARQVAHEIKNPLTPMKLSVQHLRRAFARRDDPGRFAELFERVTATLIEQIDTLAHIAADFSTLARMPTRRLERVDLNEVIREAARLMEAEAGRPIELALHPEPLVVQADREELRRAYINLIKNALQALVPERPGRVRVTTRLEVDGDGRRWAYSTVEDNGRGIPEALRPKIFEPNFSTKTGGSGLGLAIVRQCVLDLQGAIGFESEEGVGTTFWLRLPLASDAQPPEASENQTAG
ncbi:integral membrane sensor signal transduction histidine kinase [Rhodothermus marinus SG0.5JP17-172]|uniref:ATP-binding protein n=1 Tax=Rhodothermus marinus TaxID=29549 RepID=UPI000223DB7C|nr:ATP-binding protein [Rhodothermus marinus]AEN74050.1 integral membrane sensor signal transduction histidine kinase [Rhodothermus marinus SG0.5JP17-172]